MPFTVDIDANSAFAHLDGIVDEVRARLVRSMRTVEESILADARSRAVGHVHSVGKWPGEYIAGFVGGVKSRDDSRVVGWVANKWPLAHLIERGFTIKDLLIESKGVMALLGGGSVAELFAHAVHRHQTAVPAYPALLPAFETRKGEVESAVRAAVQNL